MKLPKKYEGITPGEWKIEEMRGIEGELCFQAIRLEGSHQYISSTWGGPNLPNATLHADSPRLAAAVVELREALESCREYIRTGQANNCDRLAEAALESTKEWEA